MIVRVISQGQFVVPDDLLDELNGLDDLISAAVAGGDQGALDEALGALIDRVYQTGSRVDDDLLIDSDVILPDRGVTVAELKDLLTDPDFGDGLIPG